MQSASADAQGVVVCLSMIGRRCAKRTRRRWGSAWSWTSASASSRANRFRVSPDARSLPNDHTRGKAPSEGTARLYARVFWRRAAARFPASSTPQPGPQFRMRQLRGRTDEADGWMRVESNRPSPERSCAPPLPKSSVEVSSPRGYIAPTNGSKLYGARPASVRRRLLLRRWRLQLHARSVDELDSATFQLCDDLCHGRVRFDRPASMRANAGRSIPTATANSPERR